MDRHVKLLKSINIPFHLEDVGTNKSTWCHLVRGQHFGCHKPFMTRLFLEHLLEVGHDLISLHIHELLLQFWTHGSKPEACHIIRVILFLSE